MADARRAVRRRGGGWAAWMAVGLSLSATVCAPPRDGTPQIRVVPGAAARSMWIGRERSAPSQAGPRRCPMRPGEASRGPTPSGSGDLVIENDEVVFVVEAHRSGSGFAESGATWSTRPTRARLGELGQSFTFFRTFPRQAVYDKLTSGVRQTARRGLAEGRELLEANVAVKTRYSLARTDRALLLETTVTNKGTSPTGKLGLGDVVQWGGAEKVIPGKPPRFKGTSTSAFIGGVGRFVSYALAPTEGDVEALNGVAWSDTFQRRDLVLAPGQSVSYARVLVVGERPHVERRGRAHRPRASPWGRWRSSWWTGGQAGGGAGGRASP